MMKLPLDFIGSAETWLVDEIGPFLDALSDDPTVSLRLNPLKMGTDPAFFIPANPVPWSQWGYYLKERPPFTFDPLLHAGCYYVQEASSMFVEHVARERVLQPAVCLDLCAAPGGKSLSLLSALPEGSLLVSNEVVRQRANVLSETIIKSGNSHVMVTNNGASDFGRLSHFFDVILVDAPCSGEGMFRKDPVAIEEWSPDNVKMCAQRQRNILDDIWPALKPGGLLIYSTCTYNIAENEEVVLQLVRSTGARPVEVKIDPDWGISSSFDDRVPGYRFFPHRTRGEGLSLFLLQKPDEEAASSSSPFKRKKNDKKFNPFLRDASPYAPYLRRPHAFRFVEKGSRVVALPSLHAETLISLDEALKTVSMGVEVGEMKGKDFIPAHALAMSGELSRSAFSSYPVAYEQAIAYLRKEALTLADAPKGFLLLTYNNVPLGFVKNLGSRANNLYPGEWRVRSGHLPNEAPRVIRPF